MADWQWSGNIPGQFKFYRLPSFPAIHLLLHPEDGAVPIKQEALKKIFIRGDTEKGIKSIADIAKDIKRLPYNTGEEKAKVDAIEGKLLPKTKELRAQIRDHNKYDDGPDAAFQVLSGQLSGRLKALRIADIEHISTYTGEYQGAPQQTLTVKLAQDSNIVALLRDTVAGNNVTVAFTTDWSIRQRFKKKPQNAGGNDNGNGNQNHQANNGNNGGGGGGGAGQGGGGGKGKGKGKKGKKGGKKGQGKNNHNNNNNNGWGQADWHQGGGGNQWGYGDWYEGQAQTDHEQQYFASDPEVLQDANPVTEGGEPSERREASDERPSGERCDARRWSERE